MIRGSDDDPDPVDERTKILTSVDGKGMGGVERTMIIIVLPPNVQPATCPRVVAII